MPGDLPVEAAFGGSSAEGAMLEADRAGSAACRRGRGSGLNAEPGSLEGALPDDEAAAADGTAVGEWKCAQSPAKKMALANAAPATETSHLRPPLRSGIAIGLL